jgi:putative hydrolase of the HAD superfamily
VLFRSIAQRFSEILDEPQSFQVYPDAFPALSRLRQEGYILGVVSNWRWSLPEVCSSLGLAAYFDFILASSRAGSAKPHPGIFQKALELAGVSAEQAMHVGDSLWADVQGANAVGIRGVLLDRSWAGHSEYPVIRDLGEIFKLLETGG